jgi:hypothetical protein
MSADDRLSLDPFGPVEGGDGIVEGSHIADVCPQPTNPDPLDELTQLGAIGYDDEVDSQAARGRALVGPVTVTSVPPARIRSADRFSMSPPMTSKTRSTSPTPSRASLSRSTNSCAPKSRPSDGRQRARCR